MLNYTVCSTQKFRSNVIATALGLLFACLITTNLCAQEQDNSNPNILFIILDDVGIDQMKSFGFGGVNPPKTPTIDMLARSGVRFSNTWSMPECSPSRAVFFTGRFPLRTNIYQAIGPQDLSNSQVSPYEMTTPRVLKTRGYRSAMFGKFHLAGPEHNPFGHGTPASLGFDYFYGYIGGLPASIDTTAGGVAEAGTYTCGFVTDATEGACRYASGRCTQKFKGDFPGKSCLESGGIFVPNTSCKDAKALPLNFDLENAYYVSPVVINRTNGRVTRFPLSNKRSRKYRTTLEVDAARNWINRRPESTKWMATVSFSSDHTPLQCPPDKLLSKTSRANNNTLDCLNTLEQRSISDRMIEATDTEIGRLLVQTGMARKGRSKNRLTLTPKGRNTMIVVVGDNGSLGTTVKAPFDAGRAKGTVYQTGVWVPLIVSGPLVVKKNREVPHMVNIADVYQLFGEIAGAKVHKLVKRPLDSKAMLPYLQKPKQAAIRNVNFTQFGANIQVSPYGNGPCLLGSSCSQTPVSKSVCEDNGGVWWGVGADDPSTAGPSGLNNCCEVNEYLYNNSRPVAYVLPRGIATRNVSYKLVRNSALDYDPDTQQCETFNTVEFFEVSEDKNNPKLDKAGTELPLDSLTEEQQENYNSLSASMDAILASQPECPGDGNIDGVVDERDIKGWNRFVKKTAENLDEDSNYTSSVFDFNLDGQTDEADLEIIQQNLGTTCWQ